MKPKVARAFWSAQRPYVNIARRPGVLRHVLCLLVIWTSASAAEISVNSFGAKGDGTTRRYSRHSKGAGRSGEIDIGTVVFKPGTYLTGALFVKSNTQLRIDEGVELRGVAGSGGYPVMPTRVAGIEMKWPAALINVYEQSNVQISGKGVGGWRRQDLVGQILEDAARGV